MKEKLLDIKEKFDISEATVKILSKPEKVLEVSIPVKMDNGDIEVFTGYRVIYNTVLGPGKGGIRFHPNVTKEEVEMLAFWMTLKNSLADLPYGGAKGGVIVDPKKLSDRELEALSRGYIDKIVSIIGVDNDIPAPDVYTNDKIMAIMLDEYEKIKGRKEPGVITGKPIVLGGDKIRGYSTSLGGFFVLQKALEILKDTSLKTIAIHGFGNAGSNFAKIAYEHGFKIVAVADSRGAVYDPNGLNIPKLIEVKKNTGSVINYEGGKKISGEELLELDVDILVPASIENIITEKNVDNVKAKIILELANGPVNYKADIALFERGVTVIPDILANSGGVIVSYFEWVQNRMGWYWTEEESKEKLRNKLYNNTSRVFKIAEEHGVSLRDAAYYIAVKRIEEAIKYRFFLQ